MAPLVPSRDAAWALLLEFNHNESLIRHAVAVEGVMRHMARKHGEDEEMWGIVGLLHDVDYEAFADNHCLQAEVILRERGWPEATIRAVLSHGWGICTEIEPQSLLERTLYAVDELTGLITACVLVRPSKRIADLTPKSVLKKWNQKGFAAGANRDVIAAGAKMLGLELTDLIAQTIAGMQEVADQIGL